MQASSEESCKTNYLYSDDTIPIGIRDPSEIFLTCVWHCPQKEMMGIVENFPGQCIDGNWR